MTDAAHDRLARRQAREKARMADQLGELAGLVRPLPGQARAASLNPLQAAIRLVAEALGFTLRVPPLADNASVRVILRAAGCRYRRVALVGDWPAQAAGPLLAFYGPEAQPVALLPAHRPGAAWRIHAPNQAPRALTAADRAALQSGAVQIYRPLQARLGGMFAILSFALDGRQLDLTLIGTLALAVGLLGLVVPVATGYLVDTVIPSASHYELLQLSMGLIAIAIASAMFQLTQRFAQLSLEGQADSQLQSAVWDRMLRLPATFFRDYTAGDLAGRANGISQIREALSGTTLNGVLTSVFALLSLVLMFLYSPMLALVGLMLALVLLATSAIFTFAALRHERELAGIAGRIDGILLQLLSGIGKLQAANAERRAFFCWSQAFARQQHHVIAAGRIQNVTETIQAVYPVLGSMALFASLAFLLGDDAITTGGFLAFNAAFGVFLGGLLGLSQLLIGVLNIVPLYERARPILEAEPEVDFNKADPGEITGDVEVSELRFRYDRDGPPILDGISFRVSPGEFVAIVGASGGGKSTLLRLLLGFERPDSGGVYFDGQDLAGLDVGALRRQLGVVLQQQRVMSGDILSNIIGNTGRTLADAEEAARRAGLDADIARMPMGMHTLVGDAGDTLSGGQRQRLLIARAIVDQPRLLILDEATSALDNATQARVSESLAALDCTRIVIAHRLSTVRGADRILVLSGGRLVEEGSYAALMDQNGVFARMAERQMS